ncbi:MAG: PAS domain-containing protein, partial [Candidatus Dadabacteria bacterium]
MRQFTPSRQFDSTAPQGADIIDALVTRSSIFIFSYSPSYKTLIAWSENAEQVLGVKDIEIARDGNLFMRHVHPDDRYLLLTDLEEALKGKSPYRATYRWIRPDTDETRWLHCRAGLRKVNGEELFEGIIIDLSDEFTGETSFIAGPDSVQSVISAFPALVFTVDRDKRLLRINRKPGKLTFNFGDEGFKFSLLKIGRPLLDCFSDSELAENYANIMDNILEGSVSHYHSRIALEETVFNLEITPLISREITQGLLFNVTDITESVKMEREIAALQKAEGLRLLAAGVAHNFNNALQAIIGQASVVVNHPDKTELTKKAG